MKRILFVDDEPMILQGLQNLLRPQRRSWEMVFVEGGEAALAELASKPFDVIVTDMRMPKMDGATLLKHVEANHPSVVRIILSGHTELEATLRSVPIAHQFLTKPCDAKVLREVVERACGLQLLLSDEVVRGAIGVVGALPAVPRVYLAITRLLEDPNSALDQVSALVERDVAMCAKVLQLVNSAFFGVPRRMASVRQAVSYLGVNMLRRVILAMEAFGAFASEKIHPKFSIDALQTHALLTGNIASKLLPDKFRSEDAFIAGMLHDVGKLILATKLPEQFARVYAAMDEQKRSMYEVEKELFGATHAEVGAYLLGLWGLPFPVVEAVAHHHAPNAVLRDSFDVLDAVFVANRLANELRPSADPPPAAIDADYFERLGGAPRMAEWRALATAIVRDAKA